jgi:hypothetical protein
VSFWSNNPVLRGAVYALGVVAVITSLLRMCESNPPRSAKEGPPAAPAPSPMSKPVAPPRINSLELMARCQPELKETPPAPTFEVDDRYNRVAVQMKVRFLVDTNGFVTNPYVSGASVVTPADQEAALDYVRHLTFETPSAEECQAVKMQMVGNFHMSKDSSGDWTTIFDAHPVYSFSGSRVVVNPN